MKLKELFEAKSISVLDWKTVREYKGKNLSVYDRNFVSLEGCPERINGYFVCGGNAAMTSLKGCSPVIGANPTVDADYGIPPGALLCSNNQLTSLEGAPRRLWGLNASNNQLKSLEGIHKLFDEINGKVDITKNPLKSNVVGLLAIKGITSIKMLPQKVEVILNRHLGFGRAGMLLAQEELIEAGFEKFARL